MRSEPGTQCDRLVLFCVGSHVSIKNNSLRSEPVTTFPVLTSFLSCGFAAVLCGKALPFRESLLK